MYFSQKQRLFIVPTSLILMLGLLAFFISPLFAESTSITATIAVDNATPATGDTVEYTINIKNNDTDATTGAATNITVAVPALPAGLTYVASSPTHSGTSGGYIITPSGSVTSLPQTWTINSLSHDSEVNIHYKATVTATGGTALTHSGIVVTHSSYGTNNPTLNQALTVSTAPTSFELYFPIIFKSMVMSPIPDVNSSNQWTVSWPAVSGCTNYEIQEGLDADFSTMTAPTSMPKTYAETGTSKTFSHGKTWLNEYFYRVRCTSPIATTYSNTESVVVGYLDSFDDTDSGWDLRRYSLKEKTVVYYGTDASKGENSKLILIRADAWDWSLASPLKAAPRLPYTVTYSARIHDQNNLSSHAPVFGGDWNGSACPEVGNVYETTNCFNNFVDVNFIWYGPIKYLVENVEGLTWCPNCGGALLKRFPIEIDSYNKDVVGNDSEADFHEYKFVVTSSQITVYIDGDEKGTHSVQSSLIADPYFGLMATTDEYQPSIWFFEYFDITPN